jgi:prevent-host-death family protein
MKQVNLAEVKDRLSKYLRLAEKEEIIITRHGKPAGILIGFATEDDWFDYRLELPLLVKTCEPAGEPGSKTYRGNRLLEIICRFVSVLVVFRVFNGTMALFYKSLSGLFLLLRSSSGIK